MSIDRFALGFIMAALFLCCLLLAEILAELRKLNARKEEGK